MYIKIYPKFFFFFFFLFGVTHSHKLTSNTIKYKTNNINIDVYKINTVILIIIKPNNIKYNKYYMNCINIKRIYYNNKQYKKRSTYINAYKKK